MAAAVTLTQRFMHLPSPDHTPTSCWPYEWVMETLNPSVLEKSQPFTRQVIRETSEKCNMCGVCVQSCSDLFPLATELSLWFSFQNQEKWGTETHSNTDTHIHTHRDTTTHTQTHIGTHTWTHAHTETHTQRRRNTQTHTNAHTDPDTYTDIHSIFVIVTLAIIVLLSQKSLLKSWDFPAMLIIFFATKDGAVLYSQQKQDWKLTVAQIMNSLLPNSDWNWWEWIKPLDHSVMT